MKRFAQIRAVRVIVLLALALLAGLASDWLRSERVIFLPRITTEAAQ